jgi:hypothetical protein
MGEKNCNKSHFITRTKTPVTMKATLEPLQKKYTLKKVYMELLVQNIYNLAP